ERHPEDEAGKRAERRDEDRDHAPHGFRRASGGGALQELECLCRADHFRVIDRNADAAAYRANEAGFGRGLDVGDGVAVRATLMLADGEAAVRAARYAG